MVPQRIGAAWRGLLVAVVDGGEYCGYRVGRCDVLSLCSSQSAEINLWTVLNCRSLFAARSPRRSLVCWISDGDRALTIDSTARDKTSGESMS